MGTQDQLTKVHNLYLLQMDMWKVLDGKVRSPDKLKQARKQLKEYSLLLKQVDWRYMGGEDVYETLEQIRCDAERKLRAQAGKTQAASVRTPNITKAKAQRPDAIKKKRVRRK